MRLRHLLLPLLLSATALPVHAGPFNDRASMCLVRETSEADRAVLIRWMFAAMSSHPRVADLGELTPAKRSELSKGAADLIVDLIVRRCRTEMREALRYEGQDALRSSFEVLGKVAMQGLMADPAVMAYISEIDSHVDPEMLRREFADDAPSP